MTTKAADSIRFGGSGFGPDYSVGPARRRISESDTGEDSGSSFSTVARRSTKQREKELFMFTVKEPIRSVLNQLMVLLKDTLEENPVEEIEKPRVASGPLGYTSLFAVRPVQYSGTKTVFRPVVR